MKTETKTVRTFEQGDIIVRKDTDWVAVRGSTHWVNTDREQRNLFDDKCVDELLTAGTWAYCGNRMSDFGGHNW